MSQRLARTLLPSALLLAVVASPLAAQDWKGRGRLQGIVTDDQEQPLVGAKVTVKREGTGDGPEPTTTDKKGRWAVGGLATGNWEVIAEHPGYVPAGGATKVIEAGIGPGETLRVTLRPVPKEQAAAEVPASASAIAQGNELLRQNKYAEARAEYERALAEIEDPARKASVLVGVAQTYAAEGNKAQAIKTLEQSLTFKPGDEQTLRTLVDVLMAEGREEEANKYLAQLPQGATVDPNALLNIGVKKYNEGSYDAALQSFDRVVRENPTMGIAYYYRGLTYLGLGKTAEAKADLQKLLELEPNHEKAAEAREFLAGL
jgi:tetratricopeptide (TPR) repeat protein